MGLIWKSLVSLSQVQGKNCSSAYWVPTMCQKRECSWWSFCSSWCPVCIFWYKEWTVPQAVSDNIERPGAMFSSHFSLSYNICLTPKGSLSSNSILCSSILCLGPNSCSSSHNQSLSSQAPTTGKGTEVMGTVRRMGIIITFWCILKTGVGLLRWCRG